VHSVAQCCMCHLALVCFYPLSQSADISLCTSKIEALGSCHNIRRLGFIFRSNSLAIYWHRVNKQRLAQLGGGMGIRRVKYDKTYSSLNFPHFFALMLLSLNIVVRLVWLLLSIRELPFSHFGPVTDNIFLNNSWHFFGTCRQIVVP